ncbi:hypothetical protein BKA70DRAFT_1408691 [Coprinopsis sp. MPI-PUGE-AT-0042]|nr:hypothetical protein BKA70DRAFT_1408691 [Coprinopsis sp. MPI-PUGE-AT-0042]
MFGFLVAIAMSQRMVDSTVSVTRHAHPSQAPNAHESRRITATTTSTSAWRMLIVHHTPSSGLAPAPSFACVPEKVLPYLTALISRCSSSGCKRSQHLPLSIVLFDVNLGSRLWKTALTDVGAANKTEGFAGILQTSVTHSSWWKRVELRLESCLFIGFGDAMTDQEQRALSHILELLKAHAFGRSPYGALDPHISLSPSKRTGHGIALHELARGPQWRLTHLRILGGYEHSSGTGQDSEKPIALSHEIHVNNDIPRSPTWFNDNVSPPLPPLSVLHLMGFRAHKDVLFDMLAFWERIKNDGSPNYGVQRHVQLTNVAPEVEEFGQEVQGCLSL